MSQAVCSVEVRARRGMGQIRFVRMVQLSTSRVQGVLKCKSGPAVEVCADRLVYG